MTSTIRPLFTTTMAILSAVLLAACSTAAPAADSPGSTASSSVATTSLVPSTSVTATPTPTVPNPAESLTTTASPLVPTSPSEPVSPASKPSQTSSLSTDLDGAVYGYITEVDVTGFRLSLDKIDWFTGPAAEQACAEDAVPAEARLNEWCTMYYFRNVNPALRVVSVSPTVAVTTLIGNQPVSGDLASLHARITTPTGGSRPYLLTVSDGSVTDVTEIYQP